MTPKPILKPKQRTVKKQNHYVPGFVYVFHDPQAIRGKNISMCKIGLSRTPKRRRYYLSEEYQSNLVIKTIVPTLNMRLTEILMHKIFDRHHVLRTRGLDGYTEWFQVNFLRILEMQISLYLVAAAVNFAYLLAATVLIWTIVQVVF